MKTQIKAKDIYGATESNGKISPVNCYSNAFSYIVYYLNYTDVC